MTDTRPDGRHRLGARAPGPDDGPVVDVPAQAGPPSGPLPVARPSTTAADPPAPWRWRGRHAAPDPAEDAGPARSPAEGRLTPVGHLVRPYVRTRGRTCAAAAFELETMISLPVPRRPLSEPEHREIGALCAARPRSVAELAAFIALPLGVTRILVADMADQGLVLVDPGTTRRAPGRPPDRSVMQRVLRGLRHL